MWAYSTIANVLRSYGIPGLITIGIISNTISYLVLKRIKSSSTAYFMSLLGLVDTGVLLTGAFSIWLNHINLEPLPLISWLGCKLTMFLFYTLADYSVLIIVIMTAERFYGIWKPVHKNFLTKKCLTMIVSFLFCCLINSHLVFTHSIISDSITNVSVYNLTANVSFNMNTVACEFVVWKEFYEKYWIFIDATIYSFIPFAAITVFNILIISLLNRAEKINKQLTKSNQHRFISKRKKEFLQNHDSQNIRYIDDDLSSALLVI